MRTLVFQTSTNQKSGLSLAFNEFKYSLILTLFLNFKISVKDICSSSSNFQLLGWFTNLRFVRLLQVFVYSRCSFTLGVRLLQVFVSSWCLFTPGVRLLQVFVYSRCLFTPGVCLLQVFTSCVYSKCLFTPGVCLLQVFTPGVWQHCSGK